MLSCNYSVNNKSLEETFRVFLDNKPGRSGDMHKTDNFENQTADKTQASSPSQKGLKLLITSGSLIAGAGIIYALCRGGRFINISNIIKKHVNNITAKISENKKNISSLTFLQRIKLKAAAIVSSLLKKTQGFGNINPVKDTAFDQFTTKIQKYTKIPVKSFFDSITNFLTRYGKKLAKSQYKAPSIDLKNFQSTLKKAVSEIEKLPDTAFKTQSKNAVIKKLGEFQNIMDKEFSDICGGFDNRFDKVVEVLNKNAEPTFWKTVKKLNGTNKKERILSKIKEFEEFIPLRNMKEYHSEIYSPLFTSKTKLSNSLLDLNKKLTISIDDIFYGKDVLKQEKFCTDYIKLKTLINKFAEPKKYNINRATARKELLDELKLVTKNFSETGIFPAETKSMQKLVELVSNDSKGAVESAASLCKVLKNSNPDLYKRIISGRNTLQKSLNNAVEFETEKSYKKLLDFSLHSVPTDMMTQFIGLGTIAYILSDKNLTIKQKIPSILEKGIPVIGGLAVAFLCNLRQVASGPQALFLALLSGFALNRLGTIVSNTYIYDNKH